MSAPQGCRLCGHPRSKLRIGLDGYAVYECPHCSAVFTDMTAQRVSALYDESYFNEEFGPYFSALFGDTDDSALREHFSSYLDLVEEHVSPGRVLDIGCAAGLFLNVAKGRGWEVQGVEISEHAAAVARERRQVEVVCGDVMEVDLGDDRFDVVAMLDVLEHLVDPGILLDRTHELIRPGGALMLVLPNDRNLTTMTAMALYRLSLGRIAYPASKVHQIYHVTYFTPKTISEFLDAHHFDILDIRPDETVRGLINEGALVRLGVSAIFALSRIMRLQNKMIVIAKPRRGSQQ